MNKSISKIDNMNRSLDNMNNHNVPTTTKLNKKDKNSDSRPEYRNESQLK